ncbi:MULTISPECIES: serine hydrolase [unclassified Caulobacter]|uniref:serine hydrolase n=1 Tax=unclassified Caulobacter TaxID=2648921 RepID=UPI0018EE7027|nr:MULTISPECIES: serine hydrolase [unclassified Caulobacter]
MALPASPSFGKRRTRWREMAFVAALGVIATAPGLARALPSPNTIAASVMAADTPLKTLNGTGLVAPRGWSVQKAAGVIRLDAPESGSSILVFDTTGGEADAAVAAAWAAYRPAAAPALAGAKDRPVRDGWDQIRVYNYRAPAGQARTIWVRALRNGDQWTVVLHDMTDEVLEKRDSQVEVILGKLLPAGYARESFAGRPAHKIDATRLAALKNLIETARAELDIPGVGFGLIQDDKILFEGGFGVRELGKPENVDADTAFMIGSNGKALTTLMLAKLVEQGKMDWDTPVSSLWPAFRLGDTATTAKVRVKHLVCACTGLPRQDLPWIFQGDQAQASTVLTWLSTMQPTSGFGDLYQYSNLLAASGGYLGAHVREPDRELGAAYDAAMQALVFDPLGMSRTTFDYAKALAGNHAAPHALDIDGRQQVAVMGLNAAGIPSRPDGGEWSTTRDMLRYVRMELAKGRLPNGERYIAEGPLLARRTPQVTEGSDEYYGMGLKIDRIWGVPVIHHGGTQYGYRADMIWLPNQGVGAVILTNADSGTALRSAFRRRLLEVLFDGEPRAAADLANYGKTFRASRGEGRRTLTAPADRAIVNGLAGRYANADLGDLVVRREGDKTVFDFGGWASEVASHKNDDGGIALVTITPGADGYEFEVADTSEGRGLIIREAPSAYRFVEKREDENGH